MVQRLAYSLITLEEVAGIIIANIEGKHDISLPRIIVSDLLS